MVKISNKVLLAGGLAATVGLTGCGKYEDGPNMSLLTKKQRLTGDWEVEKWVPYGQSNMINNGLNIDVEFDKDGDFDVRIISTTYGNYYGQTYTYAYTEKGEWEFSSDKEEIELDWDDNFQPDWDIEITRLTNKELEGEINLNGGTFFNAPLGSIKFEAEKD